jgi:hypothetical protein
MPSNLWLIMQLGRDKWTLCALSIAYYAIPWAGFRWWSVIMHCYANAVGNVLQLILLATALLAVSFSAFFISFPSSLICNPAARLFHMCSRGLFFVLP